MTHETGLLLLQSGWIYIGLTIAVAVVFVLSWLYGARARRKINKESIEVSSIFITSIFGFFAILVAFQLSGSTQIYENQRKLTVDEILSITAVADAAQTLKADDKREVLNRLADYVDLRQRFYERPIHPSGLETRGRALKDAGHGLLLHAYSLLPKYVGDDRIAFDNFLKLVRSMNTTFDQQYVSIYTQMPRVLWQALIVLLMIISAICGYKTGVESGQELGLTVLFLVVVLAAIAICLNLGNPRISSMHLDLVDAQFPKLLVHLKSLR
jgi:hypothetical protein